MCVESIFHKAKNGKQSKHSDGSISAEQLKQQGALNGLIHLDEGYKFLNSLHGSPPYFEKVKKSMIRQLGPATLFYSFSSAEMQWLQLLRILGQLVGHKQYTDEELENFNWEDRGRFIQSNNMY